MLKIETQKAILELPWLLMTMIIVGICLMEEIRMMKITGGAYSKYRESSPFLFPLPGWLNRILTWPGRLITKGEYPGKHGQVLGIIGKTAINRKSFLSRYRYVGPNILLHPSISEASV